MSIQATQVADPGAGVVQLYLAKAAWQLGDKEHARQWYDRAVAWLSRHELQVETTRRIRAEAQQVLGIK
jgi:hypothetical protein